MIHLLALVGIVGISFSGIFVRLATVSPATAAFFRAAYAAPVLLLFWLPVRRRDTREVRARWMAFGAGVFLALDLSFWHRSIGLIGAGLATVLANTQVVFVGLAAWALHRERPTPFSFLGIPVVFLGVALISGLGRPGAYGEDPVAGVVYGVLTGISYACFLLVFRASNRALAPPAGPLLDATLGAAAGALLFGTLDRGLALGLHWPAHGWLLALALVVQSGGWMLISMALPRLPALETSVLLLLQPVLTVFWGVLLLGEEVSQLQGAGVLLVLASVGGLSALGSVRKEAGESAEQRAARGTASPSHPTPCWSSEKGRVRVEEG